MFYKHPCSVIGPNEDVVIPKITQDNGADYEGENWNVAEHSWIRMNRTCAQCSIVVIAEMAQSVSDPSPHILLDNAYSGHTFLLQQKWVCSDALGATLQSSLKLLAIEGP